jgi:hypothetical protein
MFGNGNYFDVQALVEEAWGKGGGKHLYGYRRKEKEGLIN